MDLEFSEGRGAPRPPADVRFVAVTAELYADHRRVKLSFEVTPFLQRPSLEIRLLDPDGGDLGSISVIDVVGPRFSLTAHLRGNLPGEASIRIVSVLGYDDLPDVDRNELTIDLPAAGPATGP